MGDSIQTTDPKIAEAITKEVERQKFGLELIPSENYVSKAVLQAMGSVLTNKYSEGYPKKRYYGGNQNVDTIESLAIERAKKLFNVVHANVQPYSGSPANFAVHAALLKPGDCIMGLALPDGGHLTHGWSSSVTGQFFRSVQYHVKEDGFIDIDEVRRLAHENKPKLMWVGATAYVREFPFEELSKIADEVGAYLAADIAHIAGLVVGGVHKSPSPFAHIVTTTTHKTLRGPRGGMIMVTQKGVDKDPELPAKIDKAIFPGLQGGPHNYTTAGIAVALQEASLPEFKDYAFQIVKNSKELAKSLMDNGIKIVSSGTDNHMIVIDLTPFGKGKGVFVQEALDEAGLTANKNTIPKDPSSPFYPSGLRLGTPAITSRGLKEPEMAILGKIIANVIFAVKDNVLSDDKEQRAKDLEQFRNSVKTNSTVLAARKEVLALCNKFPLYDGMTILQ